MISFDCWFSTRNRLNYTLLLTSHGASPKFFLFQVQRGYWIKPYFDDFYSELAFLLNNGAGSGSLLKSKKFLDGINSRIPTQASQNCNPSSSETIRLRPDVTEQRERLYFDTLVS